MINTPIQTDSRGKMNKKSIDFGHYLCKQHFIMYTSVFISIVRFRLEN